MADKLDAAALQQLFLGSVTFQTSEQGEFGVWSAA
jgi:hypothetical protein